MTVSHNRRQTLDRSPTERADVCIIGAGVAGALVADSLADRGHEVVVLEAGPRFTFESRLERMERSIRPEHDPTDVWNMGGARDEFTSSGGINYELNRTRVKGVGGTTLHWLGTTPRLHEKDFEMRSRYGLADDWPISYRDLRPYYETAEKELGVAGAADNPFSPPREGEYPMEAFPPSWVDSLYATACEALGITIHSVPQARNSVSYDERSECLGFSTCSPVCPSGAKYSGDVHIQKAEQNGTRVIDRVPVQRLEHNREGTNIEAAVYVTPQGDEYRQEARIFVVACGAVETPRLLLLSRSEKHPDGLGNSSSLVGKYFTEHPSVRTAGVVSEQTNQNPIGFYTSSSEQFYDHEDAPPGSIFLLFDNTGPESPVRKSIRGSDSTPREELLDPFLGDAWGDKLLEAGSPEVSANHKVAIDASVEQLPRKANSVTLDTDKSDHHGNPVPDISLNIGKYELQTMNAALTIQRKILEEMDATITHSTNPSTPEFGAHHMGTTRMGNNPNESVVTPQLRAHDLENLFITSSSVFVTVGAVNPTLTIAALSLRLADHIHSVL